MFQPSVEALHSTKKYQLKRQGQSYTHRGHSEAARSNQEALSYRELVRKAAFERLSVGKLRVKAKLHQPDYVPKKEFGFRTINSPTKFRDITDVEDSAKTIPVPQGAESLDPLERVVLPDSFLASQKVQPLINQVQHESPSGKFQTKLLEREKERQMAQMEARVRKLEIDR